MSEETKTALLLKVWMELDEIKNLVSVCKKGLDAEIKTDNGEIRSVLAVIEKLIGEVICEIDENIV